MNGIQNAKITNVSITMEDHGALTFYVTIQGNGWGGGIGGYVIGFGYLGAKPDDFNAENGHGLEAMMLIMNTVGVAKWEDLAGKYCRVEIEGQGSKISKIGNIIEDKWFDIASFFKEKQK